MPAMNYFLSINWDREFGQKDFSIIYAEIFNCHITITTTKPFILRLNTTISNY